MDAPTLQIRGGEKVAIDEFVDEYLTRNPSKTKTEALQEWNREKSRRTQYTAGFTGRTHLSNLPPDIQRTILTNVPGGRYSIITTKQTNPNRVEVPIKDLCTLPISVGEFKRYVFDKLERSEDLEVCFVRRYGIYVVKSESNTKKYFSDDKRLTNLVYIDIEFIPSKKYVKLTYKYSNIKQNRDGTRFDININSLRRNQIQGEYLVYDKTDEIRYSGINIIPPGARIRIEAIYPLMKELLDKENYAEYPDIICDYNTTIEIVNRRKKCKELGYDISQLASDIFHRGKIVDNMLTNKEFTSDRRAVRTARSHINNKKNIPVEIETEYDE